MGPLHGWGTLWTLLGVFAGGLALNLTPCVYPLIPITVSFFGTRGSQGRGEVAKKSGKPVIVDFSATWCTPCRELDEITFHHPEIVKLADRDFVMVKVDLTRKNDQAHDTLIRKHSVKGVPTVVFIDRRGYEHQKLRVVDYVAPDEFLALMKELKDKAAGSRSQNSQNTWSDRSRIDGGQGWCYAREDGLREPALA